MSKQDISILSTQLNCDKQKAKEILKKYENDIDEALFQVLNESSKKNPLYVSTENQIKFIEKKEKTENQKKITKLREICEIRDKYLNEIMKEKGMKDMMETVAKKNTNFKQDLD